MHSNRHRFMEACEGAPSQRVETAFTNTLAKVVGRSNVAHASSMTHSSRSEKERESTGQAGWHSVTHGVPAKYQACKKTTLRSLNNQAVYYMRPSLTRASGSVHSIASQNCASSAAASPSRLLCAAPMAFATVLVFRLEAQGCRSNFVIRRVSGLMRDKM